MPDRAHVTSVDALETFRASLIIYLSKARPALEEVSADVQRTRGWLESEQWPHWEREVRRRGQVLQEAQQALFSARGHVARPGAYQILGGVQTDHEGAEEVR